MKIRVNNTALELVRGDITEMDTDAIVNAANTRLILGGGVAAPYFYLLPFAFYAFLSFPQNRLTQQLAPCPHHCDRSEKSSFCIGR